MRKGSDDLGAGKVLGLIKRGEATTRREIHEVTRHSRVTVAHRVDALHNAGLIRHAGEGEPTGCGVPKRLEFDVTRSALLVATVDTAHTRTAVTDLEGRIPAQHLFELEIGEGPDRVLGAITQSLQELGEPVHWG